MSPIASSSTRAGGNAYLITSTRPGAAGARDIGSSAGAHALFLRFDNTTKPGHRRSFSVANCFISDMSRVFGVLFLPRAVPPRSNLGVAFNETPQLGGFVNTHNRTMQRVHLSGTRLRAGGGVGGELDVGPHGEPSKRKLRTLFTGHRHVKRPSRREKARETQEREGSHH
jgi:hypothetical protein